MPAEYHDINSDFINLNATQSIHLESNRIFINNIDVISALNQLLNMNKQPDDETILSHKSSIDENNNVLQTKVNIVESNLNQLANDLKNYMETIDNINKKFKYVESNQVDIMSIMTRVITVENANKELIHVNEALHKIIYENNDKIDKLTSVVENLLNPNVDADVEIPEPDDAVQQQQQQQTENEQQISRAKSIVGKKKK